MKPLFAIQIPVFRSSFLEPCLHSVMAQTDPSWELVILVDALGRTDESEIRAKLRSLEGDPRVRVAYGPHRGVSGARLKLFEMTECPYIIALDDDDILMENAVESCRSTVLSHPVPPALIRAFRLEFTNDITTEAQRRAASEFVRSRRRDLLQSAAIRHQAMGKRIRHGVPTRLDVGQFYCLNRSFLRNLRIEVFPEFKGIGWDVDCLLKLEEQGDSVWVNDILYLKRVHPAAALKTLSAGAARRMLRRYVSNMSRRRSIHPIRFSRDGELDHPGAKDKSLNIELSTHCNLDCIFCPKDAFRAGRGWMSETTFRKTLDRACRAAVDEIYLGGRHDEPFLHPRIVDFIEWVRRDSALKLRILTNGTCLTPRLVDRLAALNDSLMDLRLMINLPSLEPSVYSRLTRRRMGRTLGNIEYAVSRVPQIGVVIQCVVGRPNAGGVGAMTRHFTERNVPVDTTFCHNRGGFLRAPRMVDDRFYAACGAGSNRRVKTCRLAEELFFVSWRGAVLPCSNDWTTRHILGNVHDDDLDEIHRRLISFRASGAMFSMCGDCNMKELVYTVRGIGRRKFRSGESHDLQ